MKNSLLKYGMILMCVFALLQTSTVYAKPGEVLMGVVNINTATAAELGLLPGIGDAKAALIIDARSEKAFNSKDELLNVKGIGEKMMVKLAPYIVTEGATTLKIVEESASSSKPVAK